MMTTRDFIALLRERLGARTDYALAKSLGKPQTTIARWTRGAGAFGQAEAIEVAAILDLPPEFVLACVEAERAKSDAARRVWTSIADRFKATAAAVLAALALGGIALFSPGNAEAGEPTAHCRSTHYAKYRRPRGPAPCRKRTRRRRLNKSLHNFTLPNRG